MKRNKYEIKVKMIKETTMIHEQETKELALEDVKKVIKNSNNNIIEDIFKNGKTYFIYEARKLKNKKM